MHRRRAVLGLALSLLPLPALAQPAPTAESPSAPPPPAEPRRPRQPQRPPLAELDFDQMTPRQRRRVQERLAGEGRPPLSPEEARRMWNGMDQRQRRNAMRRQSAARGTGQPRRGQGQPPASGSAAPR